MHKGCKRRGRMGHLARAKTGVGARQLKSWRAKLARQLGSWRANFDLASFEKVGFDPKNPHIAS